MAFPANMTVGQIRELVENPGMSIRQPAVALFTVDTADRYRFDSAGQRTESTQLNNIYINKQQTLMNGYFTRIALTELNMPWDIPNVNARNNTLTIQLAAGQIVAVVPPGFYTPDELAAVLVIKLNEKVVELGLEDTYVFDVTYNDVNAQFTIENTESTGYFYIAPRGIGAAPPFNTKVDEDLSTMMGFGSIPASFPEDIANKITGGYASMLYTPYFDIVSSQLTKKQNINDNSTSVITGNALLARVYITSDGIVKRPAVQEDIIGCRPFTIHKEFQNPKQIYWDTKEFISVIDLQLVDYRGNVLFETPLTVNGSEVILGNSNDNYQMTFQITET